MATSNAELQAEIDRIMRMAIRLEPVDLRYDVNKDGRVSSADAYLVSSGAATIPPPPAPVVQQPWWVGQFASEADANFVDTNRNQQIEETERAAWRSQYDPNSTEYKQRVSQEQEAARQEAARAAAAEAARQESIRVDAAQEQARAAAAAEQERLIKDQLAAQQKQQARANFVKYIDPSSSGEAWSVLGSEQMINQLQDKLSAMLGGLDLSKVGEKTVPVYEKVIITPVYEGDSGNVRYVAQASSDNYLTPTAQDLQNMVQVGEGYNFQNQLVPIYEANIKTRDVKRLYNKDTGEIIEGSPIGSGVFGGPTNYSFADWDFKDLTYAGLSFDANGNPVIRTAGKKSNNAAEFIAPLSIALMAIPGIGQAVGAALLPSGVSVATATAVGNAVINAGLQVASGVPVEKAILNSAASLGVSQLVPNLSGNVYIDNAVKSVATAALTGGDVGNALANSLIATGGNELLGNTSFTGDKVVDSAIASAITSGVQAAATDGDVGASIIRGGIAGASGQLTKEEKMAESAKSGAGFIGEDVTEPTSVAEPGIDPRILAQGVTGGQFGEGGYLSTGMDTVSGSMGEDTISGAQGGGDKIFGVYSLTPNQTASAPRLKYDESNQPYEEAVDITDIDDEGNVVRFTVLRDLKTGAIRYGTVSVRQDDNENHTQVVVRISKNAPIIDYVTDQYGNIVRDSEGNPILTAEGAAVEEQAKAEAKADSKKSGEGLQANQPGQILLDQIRRDQEAGQITVAPSTIPSTNEQPQTQPSTTPSVAPPTIAPFVTEPVVSQPSVTQPVVSEPVAQQPTAQDIVTTTPSITQPAQKTELQAEIDRIMRMAVGLEAADLRYDVNKDGRVNSRDAYLVNAGQATIPTIEQYAAQQSASSSTAPSTTPQVTQPVDQTPATTAPSTGPATSTGIVLQNNGDGTALVLTNDGNATNVPATDARSNEPLTPGSSVTIDQNTNTATATPPASDGGAQAPIVSVPPTVQDTGGQQVLGGGQQPTTDAGSIIDTPIGPDTSTPTVPEPVVQEPVVQEPPPPPPPPPAVPTTPEEPITEPPQEPVVDKTEEDLLLEQIIRELEPTPPVSEGVPIPEPVFPEPPLVLPESPTINVSDRLTIRPVVDRGYRQPSVSPGSRVEESAQILPLRPGLSEGGTGGIEGTTEQEQEPVWNVRSLKLRRLLGI